MQTKTKLKIILVFVFLVGIGFWVSMQQSNTSIAAQIDQNFLAIQKDLSKMIIENPEMASSSNPYDYIKDNKNFDNIVQLGDDALPIIAQKIKSSNDNGLNEYILAIAIERIAKVDLKKNGEGWTTAKEFSQVWSKHLRNIPNSVEQIVTSNQSDNLKMENLINLGTPALPFIIDKVEQGNIELFPAVNILIADNNINITSITDPQEWIKQNKEHFNNLRSLVINE